MLADRWSDDSGAKRVLERAGNRRIRDSSSRERAGNLVSAPDFLTSMAQAISTMNLYEDGHPAREPRRGQGLPARAGPAIREGAGEIHIPGCGDRLRRTAAPRDEELGLEHEAGRSRDPTHRVHGSCSATGIRGVSGRPARPSERQGGGHFRSPPDARNEYPVRGRRAPERRGGGRDAGEGAGHGDHQLYPPRRGRYGRMDSRGATGPRRPAPTRSGGGGPFVVRCHARGSTVPHPTLAPQALRPIHHDARPQRVRARHGARGVRRAGACGGSDLRHLRPASRPWEGQDPGGDPQQDRQADGRGALDHEQPHDRGPRGSSWRRRTTSTWRP